LRPYPLISAALLGALASAAPNPALAQPDESAEAPRPPIGLELAAGTQFPLQIGVDAALELPGGITGHFGLGWMPGFYRDLVNDSAVSFGWYDETDAAVIAAALEDGILFTPGIGWRPPPLPGLELYGGYVLGFLSGTITREEAEEVSGEQLRGYGVMEVPLSGTAHGFQVGLAYQLDLQRHLALRLSLAYFQLFDTRTSIDVPVSGAAAQRVADRVETSLDDRVRELLTTYVKAPLLGAGMVYRF
jgi:hypothetical protein